MSFSGRPYTPPAAGTDPALVARVDAAEAKNTSQDSAISGHETRLAAAEGKNTSQDSAISANTSKATANEVAIAGHETRIVTLEGKRFRRAYKGSDVFSANGTWTKATALTQAFLAGIPAAALEVDLEAIGGGGSGSRYSGTGVRAGGSGGCVGWRRGVPLVSLPATVGVVVGAGGLGVTGTSNGNAGGDSTFGSYARGCGGAGGGYSSNLSAPWTANGYDDAMRFIRHLARSGGNSGFARMADTGSPSEELAGYAGPGAGACQGAGGDSNLSRPEYALSGGAVETAGQSATNPFQYGSGAGAGGSARAGGWPGGGGNSQASASTTGAGGGGAVRIHYYAWEAI